MKNNKSFKNKYFERKDSPASLIYMYAVLIIMCVITVYPMLSIFTVSLRPSDQIRQVPSRLYRKMRPLKITTWLSHRSPSFAGYGIRRPLPLSPRY